MSVSMKLMRNGKRSYCGITIPSISVICVTENTGSMTGF